MDEVMHVLGGAFLGATLSPGRQAGLCVGFALLFAWETWQGSTATGVIEAADVLAGAVGLTSSWVLFQRNPRRGTLTGPHARVDPAAWDRVPAIVGPGSAEGAASVPAPDRLDLAA